MSNINQARNYLNTLKTSQLYAIVGKASQWDELDSIQATTEYSDLNDAIFAKKFLPLGFSLAIKHYQWVEDVFEQYNGNTETLVGKMFYCVADGHIYKCLSNNNGAVSTEQPTLVTPEPFELSDGYVWKYIASIPEPVAILFNYSGYVAIKNVTSPEPGYELQYASQSSAVKGTVDRIDVIQSGKKYSPQTEVYISGDGTGATAIADIHTITGEIKSIVITNRGTGYTNALVTVIDPSNIAGEGAILQAILSPYEGHGASPEDELLANYIVSSLTVENNENGFIKGDVSFRKMSLVYDLKQRELETNTILPKGVLQYKNFAEPLQVSISTKLEVDSLDVMVNGTHLNVYPSEINPYGGNQEGYELIGLTVWYTASTNTWKFDFGDTLSADFYENGLDLYYSFTKDDSLIFGDIENPTEENTIIYKFVNHESVNNEINDSEQSLGTLIGSIYDMTKELTVSNVSGDFEINETLQFVNGGTATLVYTGESTFYVSSSTAVITGDIIGVSSGATATVTEIKNDREYSAKFIKRYSFDVRTKSENDNLRITPVFEF